MISEENFEFLKESIFLAKEHKGSSKLKKYLNNLNAIPRIIKSKNPLKMEYLYGLSLISFCELPYEGARNILYLSVKSPTQEIADNTFNELEKIVRK